MSKPAVILFLILAFVLFVLPAASVSKEEGVPRKAFRLTPVPAGQVKIQDEFWAPRIAAMTGEGLEHQYRKLVETGRIENFRRAAQGAGNSRVSGSTIRTSTSGSRRYAGP